MRTRTYLQASLKVLKDLDMHEESPVEPDELVELFNDAIEDAQAEINRLCREEDYFLTTAALSMVAGESIIQLPADIYVRDIRRLIFADGSNIYPVKRFRGQKKFERIARAQQEGNSDDYRYFEKMDAADSQGKIILVPAARETSDTLLTCYYIREARRIPLIADGSEDFTNATVIDIPQFAKFIFAHVKVSIMVDKLKEPGGEVLLGELQAERQRMVDTLSGFRDDDDEIEPDVSHYTEHT